MRTHRALVALAILGLSGGALADAHSARDVTDDFGASADAYLDAHAQSLFGFQHGIASSTASVTSEVAEADPTALATVAPGLRVRVVSAAASLGANTDQIALWPSDSRPTHLIVVNEQGTSAPGVQRVRLSDGAVETILTGITSGDPLRRTPWGTILAGEEGGATGQMIEIINPLTTSNVIYDRVTGTTTNGEGGSGAENVAPRWALGRLAFEGLAILPSGITYYGDERGPSGAVAGGAYFKFIPQNPYLGGGPITSLTQSPLAAGQVYGLKLSRGTNNGQGNNTGLGVWVAVPSSNNANLRAAAPALGLTGYYRPEDLELDTKAFAAGKVRACGNNTGNEGDRNFGETLCITDGTLAEATANTGTPEVQYFVLGNPELAMQDNLAQHPTKSFWAILEDGDGPSVGRNNDVWACLDDGADADALSDGCLRFATLNDLTAEWTGGIFDATGRHFYVSVQHNVTGHGVILDITGWGGHGR